LTLKDTWATGDRFTAADQNEVSAAINAAVPWSGGAAGLLPATSGQKLTTQGGNTLDDGAGNMVAKGAIALTEMDSAPAAISDKGQIYVASDGALRYRGPTVDTQLMPDMRLRSRSILEWGAKVDGTWRRDGRIAAGALNVVLCDFHDFTAADVGKTIIIGNGAAVSGIDDQAHITTITAVSGGKATIATPAAGPCGQAFISWGTDDGPAWTQALTDMISNGGAQLTMPAGISICGQAISLAPTKDLICFALRGTSVSTSRIVCTASGGFLTVDTTGVPGVRSCQFDFSDFTVQSAVAGGTHALSVTGVEGGTDYQHAVTIERVTCSGYDTLSGYFDRPIEAIGLLRPLFNEVIVAGLLGSDSSDYSDSSALFKTALGINMNGCYSPVLNSVRTWFCNRGIQMVSTKSPGPEGGFLTDCAVVSCREGVYWETPGIEPQLSISGGHYNNRDWNICLNGKKYGMISHQLSYMMAWAPTSALTTAVTTGSAPTTLELDSTSGFARAGAVLIGSEWFTYNNLASGMDGTTLRNVVRAQFGTKDPGVDYAVAATVAGSQADVLLLNTKRIRIDNLEFASIANAKRSNVMLHSDNIDCSVENGSHDAACIGFAIGKDSTGTELMNNSMLNTDAAIGDMIPVLDGATDTVYRSKRARSCRLVKSSALSIPSALSPTAITWDGADWDTEGFWTSGYNIVIPAHRGIKRVRLTVNVVFGTSAVGTRGLTIGQNGTHAENGNGFRAFAAAPTSPTSIGSVCELSVADGDVLNVGAFQDSGGSLSVVAGAKPAYTFVICEVIEGA